MEKIKQMKLYCVRKSLVCKQTIVVPLAVQTVNGVKVKYIEFLFNSELKISIQFNEPIQKSNAS